MLVGCSLLVACLCALCYCCVLLLVVCLSGVVRRLLFHDVCVLFVVVYCLLCVVCLLLVLIVRWLLLGVGVRLLVCVCLFVFSLFDVCWLLFVVCC